MSLAAKYKIRDGLVFEIRGKGEKLVRNKARAALVKKLIQSKPEALKVEAPKVEAIKVKEPKVEKPKAEEPKVEKPKVEKPKVEKPSGPKLVKTKPKTP